MLEKNPGNWNKKHKLLKSERRRNPLAPSHTPLPVRLENTPPKNSSIESKVLDVIEKKLFMMPAVFLGSGSSSKNWSIKDTQAYILEKWPLKEAVGILKDTKEIETFGLQCTRIRFSKNSISSFSIPHFQTETGLTANNTNVPWLTNIFYKADLASRELPYSKSSEAKNQNYYQNIARERGLDLVYLKEVESLLKGVGLLKNDDRVKLEEFSKRISIISIPKNNTVIVLARIGQRATGRIMPRPMPIIIQTDNPQKLVDFLFKYKSSGLNSIFSLISSEDLSPVTPAGFQRSEVFYADENQTDPPFVLQAQLKEYEILKKNGTLIEKVKRLRPIED